MRRALAVTVLLLVGAASAHAYPLLGFGVAGSPFESPTDADATALWWNPAALAPLQGLRLTLASPMSFDRESVSRYAIDDTMAGGGRPGAGAPTTGAESIARDAFLALGALTWNFNENVTVAFGVFAPWTSCPLGVSSCRLSGPAGATRLPGTYHLDGESFTNIYFSAAVALHVGGPVDVGVGVSIVDSFTDYSFSRDSALDGGSATLTQACNSTVNGQTGHCYENPNYQQSLKLHGSGGVFWKTGATPGVPLPSGVATNFGVLLRPSDRLWIGASWQRVFPIVSSSSSFSTSDALGATLTTPGGTPYRGGDVLFYSLPDVWHLGARIGLAPRLVLAPWMRVVVYGGYTGPDPASQGLVVRLDGDPVTKGGAPTQIVLDRGLRPTVAVGTSLRWTTPDGGWRLGGALAFETSAVPPELVSAEAIDADKLDVTVGAEWHPARWFGLALAGGVTVWLPVDVNPGAFDPAATVECADRHYDVTTQACGDALYGRGLPSAAGQYSRWAGHATVTAIFTYD